MIGRRSVSVSTKKQRASDVELSTTQLRREVVETLRKSQDEVDQYVQKKLNSIRERRQQQIAAPFHTLWEKLKIYLNSHAGDHKDTPR
jgi:hypothetical protein